MHGLLLFALLPLAATYSEPRCPLTFEYPAGWHVESDAQKYLTQGRWDCSAETEAPCDESGPSSCDVWILSDGDPSDVIRVEVYEAPDDCFESVAELNGFQSIGSKWVLGSNVPPTKAEYSRYRGRQIITGYLKYYYGDGDEAPGGLHTLTVIGDRSGAVVIRSPEGAQTAHHLIVQTVSRSK